MVKLVSNKINKGYVFFISGVNYLLISSVII